MYKNLFREPKSSRITWGECMIDVTPTVSIIHSYIIVSTYTTFTLSLWIVGKETFANETPRIIKSSRGTIPNCCFLRFIFREPWTSRQNTFNDIFGYEDYVLFFLSIYYAIVGLLLFFILFFQPFRSKCAKSGTLFFLFFWNFYVKSLQFC